MSIVQDMASAMTGGKVSDALIAGDLLTMAKMGAVSATTFCLEAATPELRAFFAQCAQSCLQSQEHLTQLAEKKEWYHAFQPPVEQLKEDLKFVQALRH
jgi:spore coat protein CotF